MNRDEIIQLAKQAGHRLGPAMEHELVTFANLIAAREREACAKVCDSHAEGWEGNPGRNPLAGYIASNNCAVAIRARRES